MSEGLKFDEGKAEAMYFYFKGIGSSRFLRGVIGRNFYYILQNYEQLIKDLQKLPPQEGGDGLQRRGALNTLSALQEGVIGEITEGNPNSLDSLMKNICQVAKHGSIKYGLYNYQKGMNLSRPVNAMGRHLLAICYNQEVDPESGHLHLYHVLANIHMLQFMIGQNVGKNDLYIEVGNEENS